MPVNPPTWLDCRPGRTPGHHLVDQPKPHHRYLGIRLECWSAGARARPAPETTCTTCPSLPGSCWRAPSTIEENVDILAPAVGSILVLTDRRLIVLRQGAEFRPRTGIQSFALDRDLEVRIAPTIKQVTVASSGRAIPRPSGASSSPDTSSHSSPSSADVSTRRDRPPRRVGAAGRATEIGDSRGSGGALGLISSRTSGPSRSSIEYSPSWRPSVKKLQPVLRRFHTRNARDDAFDLPADEFIRRISEDRRDAGDLRRRNALLSSTIRTNGAALRFRCLVVRQPCGDNLECAALYLGSRGRSTPIDARPVATWQVRPVDLARTSGSLRLPTTLFHLKLPLVRNGSRVSATTPERCVGHHLTHVR